MKKNESTAPAPNTNDSDFEKIANRVSFITIVGNVLLSVIKLLAGIIAHSNAMISDAIHSASDVFSTIIVIIGIKLSARKPDKEHPYGHERMECVAAIVLQPPSKTLQAAATTPYRFPAFSPLQQRFSQSYAKRACTGTQDTMPKKSIPALSWRTHGTIAPMHFHQSEHLSESQVQDSASR